MREILFRGKIIDDCEWIEGYYALEPSGKHCILADVGDHHDGQIFLTKIEVWPKTVGQYTGLKDKNGVKIFEGDLVKLDVWKAKEVVYGDEECKCVGFSLKNTMKALYTYDSKMLEVISNVHDEPSEVE